MIGKTVWLVVSNDLDAWESSVHATPEGAHAHVHENAQGWDVCGEDEWTDGNTTVWIKEMRVLA